MFGFAIGAMVMVAIGALILSRLPGIGDKLGFAIPEPILN